MRYGIFSDIHSNLEALDKVIEAFKLEGIDRYLCVGDVVGYAANPKECLQETKALASNIIAGNHDWVVAGLFPQEYFNPYAKQAAIWTISTLDEQEKYFLTTLKLTYQNVDLTLAHGTLDNPQDFNYLFYPDDARETFALMETEVCFIGHSHVAGIFVNDSKDNIYYTNEPKISLKRGFKYIVNVGSVGQPRDGNPRASCCIYDTDKHVILIKRVDYEIKMTQKKILDAGLPRFLAERLEIGR